MELIIKPTGRCNFNCKFCSAGLLKIAHPDEDKIVPDKLRDLITTLKPRRLIITGGEPLMVEPEYYFNMHEILPVDISPTTNLKNFYLNPEKWTPLFKTDWFHPTTSFNYGDSRMWDKDTVYTEKKFIEVVELYSKYVGSPPPSFIAVIDDSNEDTVMDHVYLAKKLGMQVKLNNAVAMGFQETSYQRYKLFRHYLDIVDAGLEEYEWHCSNRDLGYCPNNIPLFCSSSIRCCYMDTNGELHVGSCEDELSMGIEIPKSDICMNLREDSIDPGDFITEECSYCELFRLCNGCKINRMIAKRDTMYCSEMQKLKDRIIKAKWLV